MIGKLLVLWRPSEEKEEEESEEDRRLAELFRGRAETAGRRVTAEKAAPKKSGAKKPAAKKAYAPVRRARPKTKRVTKKAAGSKS